MRILLFSTSPRAFRAGGMETVFYTLARALRERGHHIDEVHHEAAPYYEQREGGDVWGLPLRMIRTRFKIPVMRSVLESLRSLAWVVRCLRRTRPDVVNVHFINTCAFYFALLQPVFGYRLVLSAHGSDLMRPSKLDRALLPHLLRRADAVTVVSEALRRRALAWAPAVGPKLALVPNGVDVSFWSASEGESTPSLGLPTASPLVVSVGRLEHVKGHDVLIRAFATVRDAVPAAHLVLVGAGGRRGELHDLARSLGIADHVTFAGALASTSIRALLQKTTAFVLPSRSEGMGLALMEAMATGVPAVASAVGGVPEVVGDDAGLLVPPEDPRTLARAIVTVLSSSELRARLSTCGRRRAMSYSWDRAVAEYERVYGGKQTHPPQQAGAVPAAWEPQHLPALVHEV